MSKHERHRLVVRPREIQREVTAAAFFSKVVFLETLQGIYNNFIALKEKVTEWKVEERGNRKEGKTKAWEQRRASLS